jgi:HTH-type transcriptional repressor of NAD biosynthesis genes
VLVGAAVVTTGLVLGKFLPPTNGHRLLVDFARHYVSELTVVVGTLAREPIPGDVRVAWMRELFPTVRVLHHTDENPQYPHENPDFWEIWRKSLRRLVPVGPDYVFASEPYGAELARVLGARFVPVDLGREQVPVTGTAVRDDPMTLWEHIPDVVRPWFVRRVAILGPESTGKTTLARDLARHFGTRYVAEYARLLLDAVGFELDPGVFDVILRGQRAAEAALARQANRVLVCDTEALTTALYHELFLGTPSPACLAEAERRRYDLYLLTDDDVPWVADAQRPHPEWRPWFKQRCREWLERRGLPWVLVSGGWDQRRRTAAAAIDDLLRQRR